MADNEAGMAPEHPPVITAADLLNMQNQFSQLLMNQGQQLRSAQDVLTDQNNRAAEHQSQVANVLNSLLAQLQAHQPAPQAPAGPGQAAPARLLPSGVKLPAPPVFSGKGSVADFLFLLEENMRIQGITADENRIMFTGQCLEPNSQAGIWYHFERIRPEAERKNTWAEFKAEFLRNFLSRNESDWARDRLIKATQRPSDTVHHYLSYLRSLFMKITDLGEGEKLDRLRRGLKPVIAKEVFMKKPTTFDEAALKAEEAENALRGLVPNGHSSGSREHAGDPMELGYQQMRPSRSNGNWQQQKSGSSYRPPMQVTGTRNGGNSGSSYSHQDARRAPGQDGPRFKRLTPEEKEHYRKTGRCTYCKEHGHDLEHCEIRKRNNERRNQGKGFGRPRQS